MSRFSNPVPQFFTDDGELASSGRMYFYENKNYSLLKSTFSQPDNTVANTNPVKLDGQGRLPNCFGEGLYSVKLYAANPDNPNIDGELIWTRDDVDLSAGGDSAFSAWSPVQTYGAGSIVKDGEPYYRLYGSAASKGEQPSVTPSKWEKIVFIAEHIPGRAYPEDYIVIKDGLLYASITNGNSTTPPSTSWRDITFNQSYQDYIPVSLGTTSAGVGTYTIQKGSYLKTGRMVFGTADLFWTAHTGTGNIDISLPIPASVTSGSPAGGGQVINSQSLSWTAGKQLTLIIGSGFSVARIIGLESGVNGAQIPLDTNGGITIQFCYFVD